MADTSGVERVLRDLEQRLLDKGVALCELADNAYDPCEISRLGGKAEGVELAMSFIQEAIRTAQSDDIRSPQVTSPLPD